MLTLLPTRLIKGANYWNDDYDSKDIMTIKQFYAQSKATLVITGKRTTIV
jgi:hypothetical protein